MTREYVIRLAQLRDFDFETARELTTFMAPHRRFDGIVRAWRNYIQWRNAPVHGYARVHSMADIGGCAEVYDKACVHGAAMVHNNAKVFESAHVYGSVEIGGFATIRGAAAAYGWATITGDAVVTRTHTITLFRRTHGAAIVTLLGRAPIINGVSVVSMAPAKNSSRKRMQMTSFQAIVIRRLSRCARNLRHLNWGGHYDQRQT